MTASIPTWTDPPHRHHATIGEAGACPECRAWNIGMAEDGPHAFLLIFPQDEEASLAVALIRNWAPECSSAADLAWATGCNLPRAVLIEEIPVSVAIESGVEMFRLHEGLEATDASRAIQALRPPKVHLPPRDLGNGRRSGR